MKKLIIGFRDMFKNNTISTLIGLCFIPLISIALLTMNIRDLDFVTTPHQLLTIIICIVMIWQILGFFGLLFSLICRIFFKNLQ
jgi:hypothetical protein